MAGPATPVESRDTCRTCNASPDPTWPLWASIILGSLRARDTGIASRARSARGTSIAWRTCNTWITLRASRTDSAGTLWSCRSIITGSGRETSCTRDTRPAIEKYAALRPRRTCRRIRAGRTCRTSRTRHIGRINRVRDLEHHARELIIVVAIGGFIRQFNIRCHFPLPRRYRQHATIAPHCSLRMWVGSLRPEYKER